MGGWGQRSCCNRAALSPRPPCQCHIGFKSRAMRIGGSAGSSAAEQPPADQAAACEQEGERAAARPPVNPVPAAPVLSAAAAVVHEESPDGMTGRKRPVEDVGRPVHTSSPKLAAAVVGGEVQRAAPSSSAARASTRAPLAPLDAPPPAAAVTAAPHAAPHARAAQPPPPPLQPAAQPAASRPGGEGEGSGSDDSEPLIGSRLAARLAVDRGTPVAGRRPSGTGGSGAGTLLGAGVVQHVPCLRALKRVGGGCCV